MPSGIHNGITMRTKGHRKGTMRHAARYGLVLVLGLLMGVTPVLSQQERHLQPGSDPSVLPGPVLIADEDNDRIVLVDPQGRVVWTFPEPGDLRRTMPSTRPT